MKQADFYILKTSDPVPFLCRLIEKLHREKHTAYLHCDNAAQAELIDDALWAFDDISFIPHQILSPHMDEISPILIGTDPKAPYPHELLVLFGDSFPESLDLYQRLLYVVAEPYKNKAREHYKTLKEQQVEVFTHQI